MVGVRPASERFDVRHRERVALAVARAESMTTVEIVPVVATTSGRYDRAEDVCGMCCGVLAMLGGWWILPEIASDASSWASSPAWVRPLVLVRAAPPRQPPGPSL